MATGTLVPSPWQTIENASGVPYVAARVTTYLAGTTTLVATYTDSALTVANSNPILTDAAGRYVAYLSPGAAYKFVVTDANGVAIKTVDNITAVPASSANLDITGAAGEALTAGQAVYLSDGSGAKAAGQWFKADAANTYSSTSPEVGMVPANIASGSSGSIRLSGLMTGLTSLTIGSTYYIGTAGAITSSAPANARVLGVADTTSTLVLTPNPPVSAVPNNIAQGRLTLTTGTPVTTADVTAATTLRYAPYGGNLIALYNGSAWTLYTFSELSIAVPATTSQMYDVFVYDNGGTRTLELLAWTNDTTRATALVTQDGVLCKTSALTRRYVGSFRTTTVSGQTEDSFAKRYVWNYNNRVRRALRVIETTDTWTYSTATFRQANAAAANQLDVVVGVAETLIDVSVVVTASNSAGGGFAVSIGEDSTTTPKTGTLNSHMIFQTTTPRTPVPATLRTYPAIGRHTYVWLEYSDAVPTTTWYGDNGATVMQSGISGWIEG